MSKTALRKVIADRCDELDRIGRYLLANPPSVGDVGKQVQEWKDETYRRLREVGDPWYAAELRKCSRSLYHSSDAVGRIQDDITYYHAELVRLDKLAFDEVSDRTSATTIDPDPEMVAVSASAITSKSVGPSDAPHPVCAEDGSWIRARRVTYEFRTPLQRAAIRELFAYWVKAGRLDGHGMHVANLRQVIGSSDESLRVRKLFARCSALDAILGSPSSGVWALYLHAPPPPPRSGIPSDSR